MKLSLVSLYNGALAAIRKGQHEQVASYLPDLATKLEAVSGRGWFKLPLTGNEALDREIEKANKHLTGRVADLR